MRTSVVFLHPISAFELPKRCNRLKYAWLYQKIQLTLHPLSGK